MFVFWLNNCDQPTCEFLIQAVDAMGRRDVVIMLCQKYGEPIVPEVLDITCFACVWISHEKGYSQVCSLKSFLMFDIHP